MVDAEEIGEQLGMPSGSSSQLVDALAARLAASGRVDPGRRLVLLLVGALDARVKRPLLQARRIPARERRALHVALGDAEVRRLGQEWMTQQLPMPLFSVENDGGVVATVERVVRLELQVFDEVVVMLGQLTTRSLLGRLMHDQTADKIARALAGIPRVQVAVTTVVA